MPELTVPGSTPIGTETSEADITPHTVDFPATSTSAKRGAKAAAPTPYKTKLDAALAHARAGFAVFPLVPNAKIPAIKNWQNLATTSPAQVNEWWTERPDANVGIETTPYLVVDVDPRHGGHVTFEGLKLVEDFPDTRLSRTAGGGFHMLYRLPEHTTVRGGVGKLGPGIDIKSWGGLIVAPGSTVDRRPYSWMNDSPIAMAPEWLIERCKAARPRKDNAGKRVADEDGESIDRAFEWLAKHAPSAETGNRGFTAYKVACRLYDFGATRATCEELIGEWSATRCDPPMDEADVLHAAMSAEKNMQNPIGSKHSKASGFEPHDIPEWHPKPDDLPSSVDELLATPLVQFDAALIPPRPWVVTGYACRARVTLLAGPGGVAKSTHTLMTAVAVATGRGGICGFPIPKRERVWLWNQEDDMEEMHRRLAAIMAAFNVSWNDLIDEDGSPMLYLDSGVDAPLMLAKRTMEQSVVGTPQVGQVIADVKARKIGLLVLDPLVEFHEAGENDNVQMRAVVGQIRRIAVEGDCAVILASHTRKPPQAAADGFAGEMDAARGASSQLGVVRIGATIFSMSPNMAKAWKIEGEPSDYVRIDIAKNNLAPPRPEPIWFKRESRDIGGFEHSESIGLSRPVDLKRKVQQKESLAELIAGAIDANLPRGKYHELPAIMSFLTAEQCELFGSAKNYAAKVKKEFDGEIEEFTQFGKLELLIAGSKTTKLLLNEKIEVGGSENAAGSTANIPTYLPPNDSIREVAPHAVDNAQ